MRVLAIILEPQTKTIALQEADGTVTSLVCPFSGNACGYNCPLCGRVTSHGPCSGPGFFLDLSCGAGKRIEAKHNQHVDVITSLY